MSTQVKIAIISTVGVILAAIITAILGPAIVKSATDRAPTPTPISVPSIPLLHSSYIGSFSVTRTSATNVSPGDSMTFSSIAEDDQGHVQSEMALGSAKYICQGSVDTSRNLVLSCSKVGDANYHVVVNGHVSQDSGHLSGTWSVSDWMYPSYYVDATWSTQG